MSAGHWEGHTQNAPPAKLQCRVLAAAWASCRSTDNIVHRGLPEPPDFDDVLQVWCAATPFAAQTCQLEGNA